MLLFTIFAILLVQINAEFECPSFCKCRQSTIINCEATGVSKADLENLFKSLPREVRFFKLTKSNLTTIDTSFFSRVLPNLQQLVLEANQLNEVPKNLSGVFPALNNLNLVNNQIAAITSSDFAGLKDLKKLGLDKNKLTSIGANVFVSNVKLSSLFVTENMLEDISPDAFNGLNALSVLSLRSNKIKALQPGVFKNNKGSITLARNMIESIEKGVFEPGKALSMIDMKENKISKIDPLAFDQVSLSFLNLEQNQLTDLPPSMFKTLNTVNLLKNPLNCECNMAKVVVVVAANEKLTKLAGSCSSPENLKDTKLKNMDPNTVIKDLGCTICDLNNTCLNGATCMSPDNTTLVCDCKEGFTGVNCENKVMPKTTTSTTTTATVPTTPAKDPATPAPAPKSDDSNKDNGMTMYIIIAVVVLVILIIAAVGICICIRRRRNQPAADANDTLLKPQSTTKDVAEKA